MNSYFRLIILFLLFQVNIFAKEDAYEKRFNTLLKNQDYKELYKIMDGEVNHRKDYKHSHTWAQMYEGGFGVKKDYKKAVEFYKKSASWYKNSDSAFRLGIYYNGKKDYKKAAYWWRIGSLLGSKKAMYNYGMLNLQKKVDSDFFNTFVGSKWLQYSAKKGDRDAKTFIKKNPDLKNSILEEKLRQYNVNNTPYEKKLLGIVVGEKFNEELLIPTKKQRRKPKISINKSAMNHYKNLSTKYANQTNKYLKNFKYLNARTTLLSNTVYKVAGTYFFKTKKETERFKDYYFKKLISNSSKTPSRLKVAKLKYPVSYIDIGVSRGVSKKDWPYGVKSTKNLKGIRHLIEYYPSKKGNGFYLKVTLIDFSALKLKIAEALKSDPFFSYVGKKQRKSHSSAQHFGLTLLRKIPTNITKKQIKSSTRYNKYKIKSIYPHKFFQKYTVSTSLLTNTIFKIEAEGSFSDRMDIHNASKGTRMDIHDRYHISDKSKCWNDNNFLIDSQRGLICYEKAEGKNQVNISVNYEKLKLSFKAYSEYGKKLKDKEYWLLNN